MKRSLAPLALLVFALLAPAAANAAVRCVPAAAPGCDSNHATIGAAVAAAANDDTIRIAAGTYAEAINTAKQLTFVGAGGGTIESAAGATTIAPASGAALALSAGGTVRSLRAVGSSGFSGFGGLVFQPTVNGAYSYVVDDVVAIGGTGTDFITGFGGSGLLALTSDAAKVVSLSVSDSQLEGGGSTMSFFGGSGILVAGPALTATVDGARIEGPDSGGGLGLNAQSGADLTVTGSTLRGNTAAQLMDGDYEIRRSRVEGAPAGVTGSGLGMVVLDSTTASPATEVTLSDSLVTSAPTQDLIATYALQAQTNDFGDAVTVLARNSTLVGRGVDPDGAVAAIRQSSSSPAATVDLRNSVARMEGPVETGEGDLFADRGNVSAGSSSFSSAATANGGTTAAPGSATNIAGDPQLDGAFAPLGKSPLIDRGDQSLVAAGQLDLAGRARSLDGNGDCVARVDIGAFELPSQCPPPKVNEPPEIESASLSRKRFTARKPRHKGRKRGTKIRLELSEAASVKVVFERKAAGRRVKVKGKRRCVKQTRRNRRKPRCVRWVKAGTMTRNAVAGDNAIAFSGRLAGRTFKPGSYRATITATDSAGLRSAPRRLSFRVLKP